MRSVKSALSTVPLRSVGFVHAVDAVDAIHLELAVRLVERLALLFAAVGVPVRTKVAQDSALKKRDGAALWQVEVGLLESSKHPMEKH